MRKQKDAVRSDFCAEGLLQTTAETNRLCLFMSTLLILTFTTIVFAVAIKNLNTNVMLETYDAAERMCALIASFSVLVALITIFGCIGAFYRRKGFVKLFMVTFLVLLLFQFLWAAILRQLRQTDRLTIVAGTQFEDGWIDIVDKVVSDQDPDGEYRTFITNIEVTYQCCGFTDINNVKENPPEIPCSFEVPCKDGYILYVQDEIRPMFKGYLAFNITMLVVLLFCSIVICRIQAKPLSSEGKTAGDYYYASYDYYR